MKQQGSPRRNLSLGFGATMLLMFAFFSLLPIAFIISFTYSQNESSAITNMKRQVSRNMSDAVNSTALLFRQAENNMALIAKAVEAEPSYFKTTKSNDTLWSILNYLGQIDAIYVSFEDGYHRVVTRVDEDRRRSDLSIPKNSNWHASYIDDFSAGLLRARHRQFFSVWGADAISSYSKTTNLDLRKLPHYRLAKSTLRMAIGEPSINPDTGSAVISLGYPITKDSRFIGFVGANLTLSNVSNYLRVNKLSENSATVIKGNDGLEIASSGLNEAQVMAIGDGEKLLPNAATGLKIVTDAFGEKLILAAKSFPPHFGKDWTLFSIAAIDDFVGDIRATNRRVMEVALVVVVISVLLIVLIFVRFSQTIRAIVDQLSAIGKFNLKLPLLTNSFVKEIKLVSTTLDQMKSSLSSFSRYVPVEVVRELVASGQSAELGGERRRLTIHFSDIAGFTSIAENIQPEELVVELSDYFSTMREALHDYDGTIDKFMGDGILAFFNAPLTVEKHETSACHAALKAQERLAIDRVRRGAEGRPEFHTRIGLGVGEVIVGNIGTPDRFAYTVIGDAVNLASRLEGLNKFYGTSIIASGELVESVEDYFEWRRLDRVSVAGRTGGTDVFELMGHKDSVDPDLLAKRDAYEVALEAYFAGDFTSAAKRFSELSRLVSNDDATVVMARRARKLARRPPADIEWTGVYAHTKK